MPVVLKELTLAVGKGVQGKRGVLGQVRRSEEGVLALLPRLRAAAWKGNGERALWR